MTVYLSNSQFFESFQVAIFIRPDSLWSSRGTFSREVLPLARQFLWWRLRLFFPDTRCRRFRIHSERDGETILGLHNVAAACAILIVLLLCACTLVGVTVGILKGVVLATMTIGIIYLVASTYLHLSEETSSLLIHSDCLALFSTCLMAIMYTILKSERKQSHCFALEILTDQLCAARIIQSSYSFVLGCSLIILCFITSILWLSLQEKQRKFAQHWYRTATKRTRQDNRELHILLVLVFVLLIKCSCD